MELRDKKEKREMKMKGRDWHSEIKGQKKGKDDRKKQSPKRCESFILRRHSSDLSYPEQFRPHRVSQCAEPVLALTSHVFEAIKGCLVFRHCQHGNQVPTKRPLRKKVGNEVLKFQNGKNNFADFAILSLFSL